MRIRPRTFSLYAPLALFLCTPGVGVPVVEESPPYLSPVALVADPQSKLLYIAEFTARQIAVFEIATERVRQIIPIPDRPSGMALSADGNRLYVTGGVAAGKVYVVDTRGGLVRETLAAGHTPNAPVLSRDGNTLFVCNRFNNNVTVHDLKSKTVTARIPVGREPVAAALSGDGRYLFVANQLPSGPANNGDVAAVVSVIDTTALRSGKGNPTSRWQHRVARTVPVSRWPIRLRYAHPVALPTPRLTDRTWLDPDEWPLQ